MSLTNNKREHGRKKQLTPAKSTSKQEFKHTTENNHNQPHPGPGGKLIANSETDEVNRQTE